MPKDGELRVRTVQSPDDADVPGWLYCWLYWAHPVGSPAEAAKVIRACESLLKFMGASAEPMILEEFSSGEWREWESDEGLSVRALLDRERGRP